MSADPSLRKPVNRSAMLEKFNVFFRIFARIFFRRVRLADHDRSTLVDAGREAQVVYVLPSRSRLEYAFFNYRFLNDGLPLSRFIPGLSMLPHQTLWQRVKHLYNRVRGRAPHPRDPQEHFRHVLADGAPVTLYVREPDMLLQWGERGGHLLPYLKTLLEYSRETGREVVFVPLMLVWKMGIPTVRRTLVDKVFGAAQAPGGLRQMVGFLLNFTRVRCSVLAPIPLADALASDSIRDLPPDDQADALRLLLRNHLVLEQHVVHGPPLKGARAIIGEMLRNEEFRAAVEEKGFAWSASTESRVRRYLRKIAADFRFGILEIVSLITTFAIERMYKGVEVDEDDFERLRKVARRGPLVLVPCHRSHFDYLAISNVLYSYGLIPPHICAGENLSFWPLGPLFRGSGAFFIKRKFKGDVLYGVTLERYIWKLLREGYWLEFFIEGGRSRTGKMMAPKYGILHTVLNAHVKGYVPEMVFVPIYIGYEKVLEDESLVRELTGAKKQRENLTGVLKTASFLQSKYGRLYLKVGETIALSDELAAEGRTPAELDGDAEAFRHFSRHLAHRIEDSINQSAIVTSTSLAALSLFTTGGRGFSRETLTRRVGFFLDLFLRKHVRLSNTVRVLVDARRAEVVEAIRELGLEPFAPGVCAHPRANDYLDLVGRSVQESVQEALNLFARYKLIRQTDLEGEPLVELFDEKRLKLDLYKNSSLHFLLNEALVALVLLRAPDHALPRQTLLDEVLFLSRLFKREFVYPTAHGFEHNLETACAFLAEWGLVTVDADGARLIPESRELAGWLASTLDNFVESYRFVLARTAGGLGKAATRDAVLRELFKASRRELVEGQLKRPESISTAAFANALDWLVEAGYVSREAPHEVVLECAAELTATREHLERYRP